MFPKEDTSQEQQKTSAKSGGKSFLFDFDTGDFMVIDGKIKPVENLEAVRIWIDKILRTERFKFRVYEKENNEEEYGVSLLDFTNGNYDMAFKKIEIEREIKEALAKNTAISKVHSFVFEQKKRTLNCKFTVETIYGTAGGEITI